MRRPERAAAGAPITAEVRIESIAAGGEGVGRLADGRVVFVHRTAPGDLAAIEIRQQRSRWMRGRLLRVLEAGPARRDAPCPFYSRCGGCTLEHLEYPAQLDAKAHIVADALSRIGKLPVEPPTVIGSPLELRYRNRVSFALRRLAGDRVVAGFHEIGHPERILDIDERCLLPEEPISRAWAGLRASWGPGARRLPSGERLRLTLRATAAGRISLLVDGGDSAGEPIELLDRIETLDSIWHRPANRTAVLLAGTPAIEERWGDESLDLGGSAFLQVNRRAAALLEDHVLEVIGDAADLRIVDAYCGTGAHARRLARQGASVTGIELDSTAVTAARALAPEGAQFLVGTVEDLLPDALPADLVILNPPRAGVDRAVADALIASPPARIIYISCDPATLARDLHRLAPHYRLRSLRCFDLFPQTAHVETVAEMAGF